MVDIVVCYQEGGGYECDPYPHTLCFRYESPEAWLVRFEERLLATKSRHEAVLAAFRGWLTSQPPSKAGEAARRKWEDSRPPDVDELRRWHDGSPSVVDFVFCGHLFNYRDFVAGDKICLPDVYELREWFELRCRETKLD